MAPLSHYLPSLPRAIFEWVLVPSVPKRPQCAASCPCAEKLGPGGCKCLLLKKNRFFYLFSDFVAQIWKKVHYRGWFDRIGWNTWTLMTEKAGNGERLFALMFFFPFFWIWLDLRIKGASMKKKNLYFFVLFWLWHLIVVDAAVKLVIERAEMNTLQLSKPYTPTGSPSSKYKHRRTSTLLHNIRNIRICMGKKTIVSVTYDNQRISIKTAYLT